MPGIIISVCVCVCVCVRAYVSLSQRNRQQSITKKDQTIGINLFSFKMFVAEK
jgi:hypothetical protein